MREYRDFEAAHNRRRKAELARRAESQPSTDIVGPQFALRKNPILAVGAIAVIGTAGVYLFPKLPEAGKRFVQKITGQYTPGK